MTYSGLPILTRPGITFASRVAASLLYALFAGEMGQGGESGRGNPLPATIVFTEDDFVTTGFFLCVLRLFFFYLGVFHKPHSKGHDETMRACVGVWFGGLEVWVLYFAVKYWDGMYALAYLRTYM